MLVVVVEEYRHGCLSGERRLSERMNDPLCIRYPVKPESRRQAQNR